MEVFMRKGSVAAAHSNPIGPENENELHAPPIGGTGIFIFILTGWTGKHARLQDAGATRLARFGVRFTLSSPQGNPAPAFTIRSHSPKLSFVEASYNLAHLR